MRAAKTRRELTPTLMTLLVCYSPHVLEPLPTARCMCCRTCRLFVAAQRAFKRLVARLARRQGDTDQVAEKENPACGLHNRKTAGMVMSMGQQQADGDTNWAGQHSAMEGRRGAGKGRQ